MARPRHNHLGEPAPALLLCVCVHTRVCAHVCIAWALAGGRLRRASSESEPQGQSCAREAGTAGSRFEVLNSLNVIGKKKKRKKLKKKEGEKKPT